MSKEDLLMIIEALEYTGTHANSKDFIELKDNILKELSALAETTEDEFVEFLNS